MVNDDVDTNVKAKNVRGRNVKDKEYTVRGKGSFGCVVDPPFACNDEVQNDDKVNKDSKDSKDSKNDKKISKIFYRPNNALDEMDVYKKLDDFDKEQQFSIKPIKICQLSLSKVNRKLLKECEFEDNMNDSMTLDGDTKQIFYDDGGMSLNKFISSTSIMFEDFAHYLTNIFKALVALNEANLIHFDIKLDNIVVDIDKKGREVRIIDFAYCRTLDFVRMNFGVKSSFVWKRMVRSYFTYPMEFIYIPLLHEFTSNAINTGNNANNVNNANNAKDKRNIKILEGLQEKVQKVYSKDKRAMEYYNHLIYEMSSKKHTFFKEATTNIEEATNFFKKHTPEKIDMFSLGITLYQVYGRFLSKRLVRDPVMCEKLVLPLLEKMTHPFVKKRLLPSEALQEWESIVASFKNKK